MTPMYCFALGLASIISPSSDAGGFGFDSQNDALNFTRESMERGDRWLAADSWKVADGDLKGHSQFVVTL